MGGVLTLKSFEHDFGYTKADKTHINSNCVSILQAGAFFGCFFIWPITNWLGRRLGLLICAIVFVIGTILQVVNSHSIGVFYAGRVISGLGVGGATVMVCRFPEACSWFRFTRTCCPNDVTVYVGEACVLLEYNVSVLTEAN